MKSIKIKNIETFGWEAALRGMRNALESWKRADSFLPPCFSLSIGENDLSLMLKLIRAGSEERKFLRFIHIQATFYLPRYVWAEFDTYKVGVTKNSCSTMHKLGHRDLTTDDFIYDEISDNNLFLLNEIGRLYRKTKDYEFVKLLKQNLPESFVIKADCDFNYENAINIFNQRKNHRLEEWRFTGESEGSICNVFYSQLPCFSKLIEVLK